MIRSTKKALIASVMSLLLCTTMLIGTTFAWFTDTDTATTSNIVAGTLDIEIVDEQGNELSTLDFVNANGSAEILWEPNATFQTVGFKFVNNGNLALKYKVQLNNTEVSYNKLNEVIEFTLVGEDGTEIALDTMVDLELLPNAESQIMYIRGHMDADAGNQYQGATLSGVSITVYAAQSEEETDMTDSSYDNEAIYDDEIITVGSADAFIAAFSSFEDGQTITLTDDIDMTGKAWTAFSLANKTLTIDGNGYTVSNLSDGLIERTGSGSITIKDITFDRMIVADNMCADDNFESSALIANADTCSFISMKNVTVKNSSITSEKYAAALVGYTTGYGNDYDGPVYASHNFTNCTVMNTNISGGGSTGAIIAHAGGNKATTTTINGVTIANNSIVGEDAAHTGVIIGTSHVGEVYLNYEKSAVQAGPAIGRFVPGTTGKLTINGVEQTAFESEELVPEVNIVSATSKEQLNDAISNATDASTIVLSNGTYTLPQMTDKEISIVGGKDTVVDMSAAVDGSGSNITFDGVTVNLPATDNYTGIQHTEKVVYKDCTIVGQQTMYSSEVEFVNCTFENLNNAYCIWTYGATNATFTNCTFNTSGKAILVYIEDEHHATITVNNCVFNDNDAFELYKGAVEVGSSPRSDATTYNIYINGCKVNGFAVNNEGINTGSVLWGNKNSMDKDHLNVVIDGADVY